MTHPRSQRRAECPGSTELLLYDDYPATHDRTDRGIDPDSLGIDIRARAHIALAAAQPRCHPDDDFDQRRRQVRAGKESTARAKAVR